MTQMNRRLLGWFRAACAACGLEIRRIPPAPPHLVARRRLWEHLGIDLVLDVGANEGQYGRMLRDDLRYRGRIHSFEPLEEAYARLAMVAVRDSGWTAERSALGDREGHAVLHVAANSFSSSLLPMTERLLHAAPQATPIGQVTVPVTRLDRLFPALRRDARSVALKLDAQGGEAAILAGASQALGEIRLIEMEMSLVTLYEGEVLWMETCAKLQGLGFILVNIEPEFYDPHTGRTLQVNGTFVAAG